VGDKAEDHRDGTEPGSRPERRVRADAQRNIDTLLQTALAVFSTSGVDAPIREIADKAGVGIGTLYRHFPQRADLIAAVFRREIDACADVAPILAAEHGPFDALAGWMQRYAVFIAAKRGLAKALHSGDPAFDTLPGHFDLRLRPALHTLLAAAAAAGEVRADVDADELLGAVASLCMSTHNAGPGRAERMVALLVDGLRYGAGRSGNGQP
jgi:AcrR family transcriptional regulator